MRGCCEKSGRALSIRPFGWAAKVYRNRRFPFGLVIAILNFILLPCGKTLKAIKIHWSKFGLLGKCDIDRADRWRETCPLFALGACTESIHRLCRCRSNIQPWVNRPYFTNARPGFAAFSKGSRGPNEVIKVANSAWIVCGKCVKISFLWLNGKALKWVKITV